MPSSSEAQKKFMRLVYNYKKGRVKEGDVDDNVKSAAENMTYKQLEDFLESVGIVEQLTVLLENKTGRKIILEQITDSYQEQERDKQFANSIQMIVEWVFENYGKSVSGGFEINFAGVPIKGVTRKEVINSFYKLFVSEYGKYKDIWKRVRAVIKFFAENRKLDNAGMWYLRTIRGNKQIKNKNKNQFLKTLIDTEIKEVFHIEDGEVVRKEDLSEEEIKDTVVLFEKILQYTKDTPGVKPQPIIKLENVILKYKRAKLLYSIDFIHEFEKTYKSLKGVRDLELVIKDIKQGIKPVGAKKKELLQREKNLTDLDFYNDFIGRKKYNLDIKSIDKSERKKVVDTINELRFVFQSDLKFTDNSSSSQNFMARLGELYGKEKKNVYNIHKEDLEYLENITNKHINIVPLGK